jgi:hypothetical protein
MFNFNYQYLTFLVVVSVLSWLLPALSLGVFYSWSMLLLAGVDGARVSARNCLVVAL